ncbi:MAG: DNA repair protein RadC [Lautropia sp.]|nr:DNA repair protein RadC [Lautropia sp.]
MPGIERGTPDSVPARHVGTHPIIPDAAPVLRDWPDAERPRERLLSRGAAALSNAELLAILLRTGTRGQSAVSFAVRLLADSGSLGALLSTDPGQLLRRHGMGPARASTLAVILELARRVSLENLAEQPLLNDPGAVQDYLGLLLRGRNQEVFVAIFVNSQHRLIQADELFRGTLNQTAVYPREVIKRALDLNAAALILAHNHPSGHPEPSAADRTLTRTLQNALGQLDIRVLDHIIVAGTRQYSFAQHGLL